MYYVIFEMATFLSLAASVVSLNTCSVELPAEGEGVVSMNNVILAKWRIALSINIEVLGNR